MGIEVAIWLLAVERLQQVRGDDVDQLTRGDDLGCLPVGGVMPRVSGDQIIGAGGVGAFKEFVVVGIGCNGEQLRGFYDVGVPVDQGEQLVA